ncbi:OmpA/MotB domain protein [[Clostridium] ultunense Esp]|uniref:OmpA/MotB family protein n=1 Tax=Thermicanus aegyptius TaxID=94009 RepID=UPI0002B70ED5|nr:OmpA family protein [Thermicanus aegyptius]CCQ92454.1 OmpA/MotB domain protein [[Clostridium] ultunense Esp]
MRRMRGNFATEETGYWPSFTDMMTAFFLVMLFLTVIAFIQSIYDAYENLRITKEIGKVSQVKEEITDLLQLELEKMVGKDQVSRGPNNSIAIEGNILFPSASAELSESGKRVAHKISVALQKVLEKEEYRRYIYMILIEGHTDKIPYDNWSLSTERAVAVVKEMLSSNPTLGRSQFAKYLAATGYSEFHPVVEGDSPEDLRKNRRISFQIILDEKVWKGDLDLLLKK